MATDAILPDPATVPPTAAPPPGRPLPGDWTDWTFADLRSISAGFPWSASGSILSPARRPRATWKRPVQRTGNWPELIDGVLVEKTVGFYESVAAWIIRIIGKMDTDNVVAIAGEDSTVELLPNQVRAADVRVVCWERFPDRKIPDDPIPHIAPDLVVEVLSKSNTKAEMRRKLHDYFTAGVRLVWYIEPRRRTAASLHGGRPIC